jgi:hypothetical protein
MIEEEVKTVIEIMMTAHNNCFLCGRNLVGKFMAHFPQFADLAEKEFERRLKLSEEDEGAK